MPFVLITGFAMIAGCAGKFPTSPGTAATAAPTAPNVPPAPVTAPQSPYQLTAAAAGPYIAFTLTNNSPTELQVKKDHFAVIVPDNSRQVVPYNKHTTVIDLPEATTLKPGSSLQGRALFKEFKGVIGKRFVYKSETGAAFAEIKPQA